MPGSRSSAKARLGPPPFYVAEQDIPGPHSGESGQLPVFAFRAGEHVPAELVQANEGWPALVREPAPAELAPGTEPAADADSAADGGQREED
jgi:hypothetical protein